MITELVNFSLLETATDEQLISKSDILVNDFMKNQDGYIDAELIKHTGENSWCFIYHFESMDKLRQVGQEMRSSKEFGQFIQLLVPGSLKVTFYNHARNYAN